MKKYIILASLCLAFASCKKEAVAPVASEAKYVSFGDSISQEGAISKADMFAKYQTLKEGDTLQVAFTSKINDVCQKKGCWMNLALTDKEAATIAGETRTNQVGRRFIPSLSLHTEEAPCRIVFRGDHHATIYYCTA